MKDRNYYWKIDTQRQGYYPIVVFLTDKEVECKLKCEGSWFEYKRV